MKKTLSTQCEALVPLFSLDSLGVVQAYAWGVRNGKIKSGIPLTTPLPDIPGSRSGNLDPTDLQDLAYAQKWVEAEPRWSVKVIQNTIAEISGGPLRRDEPLSDADLLALEQLVDDLYQVSTLLA